MNTQTAGWQQALADAFTSVEALCEYLNIPTDSVALLPDFKAFPLRVPRGFADCIRRGDVNDPLLRQVLPTQDELKDYPGYSHDPVGDLAAVAEAGIIHKYHGRVLLISTGACAVHCRYCFRRNFPYAELQLSTQKVQQALTYILSHPEISEVILSGGDPLLLNDDKLGQLLEKLGEIEHVKRIRIHSRVPIVLPMRITDRLLSTLSSLSQRIVMVFHANHANELSPAVGAVCSDLRHHGITLLNQSVLLKGINDAGNTLCELSEKLFELGILPYYLHVLDHASGTGHFEVSETAARQLLEHMQCHLPGYLVPKLVKEQAGAAYKIPIC
ncbi:MULTISPECIES: EF-P beta-lysylation protein EpmB [Methylomonas]|uniref:L-lysine 2,3-aminomutase n=2 Tax=Methylomonas TaxID=416 RepID=A0A126T1Z2_9GAMM|nr:MULTISPECIES: EF-P beta-lysylation protein EpmB [Methylomonas]AMK75714.1 EF-P beta-lysylation protein EpmB [Methylomonas denitrificans]OAH98292.1 EF-P beta-lysylation protein EpmB [Methylomonas methanica]TCV82459.1 L-lysine 2,3-aminomutase [Methylomonas methanica]